MSTYCLSPPPPYTPVLHNGLDPRVAGGSQPGSVSPLPARPQQSMNPPAFPQQYAYPPSTISQQPPGGATIPGPQPMSIQQAFQQLPEQKQQAIQQIVQQVPPEKLQQFAQQISPQQQPGQPITSPQQQFQQWPAPPQQQFGAAPGKFGYLVPGPPTQVDPQEKKTGKVQRFLGDTLVGRFARASVQTASSALKMPAALSPWGDNNPVTLPNVRYRDAVLFTTFAFVGAPLVDGVDHAVSDIFGADSFVSEIVSSGAGVILGSTAIKYGMFQIIEQAIDKGMVEHLLPEEEKVIQTTNIKSLQVSIKHKLMGVDADLRFAGVYAAKDQKACEKGWFCPYLFASARTPLVPRVNDFAVAQFFGPFVGADYALAHKLIAESAHVLSLCDADPTRNIGTNRMVVLFAGLAPYRANMWSTSRRPGCGTLIFHLFDGCPALVLPVTSNAPICAWSPWTLSQMRRGAAAGYAAEWQHEQICEWLDSVVSMEHLYPQVREKYEGVLGRAVSLVIDGALGLDRCPDKVALGKVDPSRAGVVMFRF